MSLYNLMHIVCCVCFKNCLLYGCILNRKIFICSFLWLNRPPLLSSAGFTLFGSLTQFVELKIYAFIGYCVEFLIKNMPEFIFLGQSKVDITLCDFHLQTFYSFNFVKMSHLLNYL